MSWRSPVKRIASQLGVDVERGDESSRRLRILTAQQDALEALQLHLHEDPMLRAFLLSIATESRRGSSRLLTDLVAAFLLGRGRRFLEVGAWHPHLHSDTSWLESDLGWRGLQIEPNGNLASQLRRDRKSTVIEAALIPQSWKHKKMRLHRAYSGAGDRAFVSARRGGYPVATVTFDEVAETFGTDFDALFMDIEGLESDLLTDHSLEVFTFSFASIETIWNQREIHKRMESLGFVAIWRFLSGYNSWFVRRDVWLAKLDEFACKGSNA